MGLSKGKSEDLLKELPTFPLCLHTDCMIQLQDSCMIQLQALYDTVASTVSYSCKLHVWYSCKRHNAEFFLPTSGSGAAVSDVSAIYDNLLDFSYCGENTFLNCIYITFSDISNIWQCVGCCGKKKHISPLCNFVRNQNFSIFQHCLVNLWVAPHSQTSADIVKYVKYATFCDIL